MAGKRMLIADADTKAWDGIREALGESWVVVGAASNSAALAEAQKQPFDVVVANFTLPESGGAELLNRIRIDLPKTLRFIAADAAIQEKAMGDVLGGHQFLALPFDRSTLKVSIERSLAADYGMSNSMRELVSRIRTFPTIPSLYLEVVNALTNPNSTTADIGAIVAKDMAMTTKLVQVLNSAYFGLPRTITDPTEAVGILGFETVKSLIMTVKLLSQYDKVKPVYFSIDHIWRHSTSVAQTAKVMALLETGDTDCSGIAYTAGLMHDLGKVILAANFDTQYHGAHALARKQQIPLWVVEKDIFGATHGEIGAYMLTLWGMSPEVVKVAAMHHHPFHSDDKTFTPLTAVHVANALEYEGSAENDGLPIPIIDAAYLQRLGLEERIELWRDLRRNPDQTRIESILQHATPATQTADQAVHPGSTAPTRSHGFSPSDLLTKPGMVRELLRWLGVGMAVSAALVLLARFEVMRLESIVEKARMQEEAESQSPVKQQIAVVPAPEKAGAVTGHAVVPAERQPSPAPPPDPAKMAFDALKLQAIFFTPQHPAVLINGRLAGVDQQVAECRVLDIGPSSVTLGYLDQRRVLTLR
jgi:putative nucleotidyltransferase with HDIG domain